MQTETPQNTPKSLTIQTTDQTSESMGLFTEGEDREIDVVRSERRSIYSAQIINGLIKGQSYTQIAEDMGLNRKSVYDIRQSVEFEAFFNDLLDRQLAEIEDLSAGGKSWERVQALLERGKLIRAIAPKKAESKSYRYNYTILQDERRRNQEFLDKMSEEDKKALFEIMLRTDKVGGRGMDTV